MATKATFLGPIWQERFNKLKAAFGDSVFTSYDAADVLGVSKNYTFNALWYYEKIGKIKLVVRSLDLADVAGTSAVTNYYSFDFSKEKDEVIDAIATQYDPVPLEERTLEIQLFGEERERYEAFKSKRDQLGELLRDDRED